MKYSMEQEYRYSYVSDMEAAEEAEFEKWCEEQEEKEMQDMFQQYIEDMRAEKWAEAKELKKLFGDDPTGFYTYKNPADMPSIQRALFADGYKMVGEVCLDEYEGINWIMIQGNTVTVCVWYRPGHYGDGPSSIMQVYELQSGYDWAKQYEAVKAYEAEQKRKEKEREAERIRDLEKFAKLLEDNDDEPLPF